MLSFDNDAIVIAGFGADEQALAVTVDYNGDPVTNPFYGRIVIVGEHHPSRQRFDEDRSESHAVWPPHQRTCAKEREAERGKAQGVHN